MSAHGGERGTCPPVRGRRNVAETDKGPVKDGAYGPSRGRARSAFPVSGECDLARCGWPGLVPWKL